MKERGESFTLRLPPSLRAELQKRADAEGRTLSNYIVQVLRKEAENGKR